MTDRTETSGPIKAPQDFAAGLFLILLALFTLWLGANLSAGTLRSMGPGMVPRAVSIMIAGVGAILVLNSFIWRGPPLDRLSVRGPFFITLAIITFGLTIRGVRLPLPGGGFFATPALGMVGAGPLAILIGGLASPETRWGELVIFTIVMTTFCWLLFKVALNLPIPLMPLLLGA